MDKTTLVGIDIDGGGKLISILEEAGLDIRAALWLYSSDPDKWELVIATPFIDQNGPKKTYTFIQSELAKMESSPGIDLEDISAVSPEYHIIKALLKIRRVYPTGTIRWLEGALIDNVFIEAAYVYRLK